MLGGELSDGLHTERVGKSFFSLWQPVTLGVPQGSILGPTRFNIFKSDLEDGIKCILMNSDNEIKLRGEVDTTREPHCGKTWIG